MIPAGSALVRDEKLGWLIFSDPVRELVANSASDVQDVIHKVERAIAKGGHCVGWVTYEAAPAFDKALHPRSGDQPYAWFREYRSRECIDSLPLPSGAFSLKRERVALTRAQYSSRIRETKRYLKEGATYQVNFTFPIEYSFAGDPFDLFCQLQLNQQSKHSLFIDSGDTVVCSVSPELFFTMRGRDLVSRPMKGTASRRPDTERDIAEEESLKKSGKNAAENVMIVDMIRNDLGRICDPSSVRVKSLFDLERFPTVFQATSTVCGKTSAGLWEIFSALFPCASVTGAPKVETMKIIRGLEPGPRGIYTGAIGYASADQSAFNVGIRTLVIDKSGKAKYGVGSGIVWESDADQEYDECLAKAEVLATRIPPFELLETMLWVEEAGYILLDEHMARLSASARYFGYRCGIASIRRSLEKRAQAFHGRTMVRLRVKASGQATITAKPLQRKDDAAWHVAVAAARADNADRFLYHKTTYRDFYDAILASRPDLDDLLILNSSGELTESCKANVVVVIGGQHYTPPIQCGVLAGTYREAMLRSGELHERILRRSDLMRADEVYLINSVRGKIPILLETPSQPVA